MPRKRIVSLPEGSALKGVQRKGKEGACIACGQSIHTHFGRKAVWVGCPADSIPDAATFVLVPTAFPGIRATRASVQAVAHDRGVSTAVAQAPATKAAKRETKRETKHVGYAGPRYLYAAHDRRKKTIDATDAVRETYEALVKAGKPLTPVEAAKAAKAPVEANRVRLNWLTVAGLVDKIETTE